MQCEVFLMLTLPHSLSLAFVDDGLNEAAPSSKVYVMSFVASANMDVCATYVLLLLLFMSVFGNIYIDMFPLYPVCPDPSQRRRLKLR